MKLISMTEYALQQYEIKQSPYNFWKKIGKYGKFLKRPLSLSMVVPCDEKGNVIEFGKHSFPTDEEMKLFKKAKEKVLFKGFEINKDPYWTFRINYKDFWTAFYALEGKDIEYLLSMFKDIELTESALKEIELWKSERKKKL